MVSGAHFLNDSPQFITPFLSTIGIPVKFAPEDDDKKMTAQKAVQYSALISNLVMQTKYTLDHIEGKPSEGGQLKSGFHSLRMRMANDQEMIVTDFITPSSGNEYILVALQDCKFSLEEEIAEEEEADKA